MLKQVLVPAARVHSHMVSTVEHLSMRRLKPRQLLAKALQATRQDQ
jgi:hypothetical protein